MFPREKATDTSSLNGASCAAEVVAGVSHLNLSADDQHVVLIATNKEEGNGISKEDEPLPEGIVLAVALL